MVKRMCSPCVVCTGEGARVWLRIGVGRGGGGVGTECRSRRLTWRQFQLNSPLTCAVEAAGRVWCGFFDGGGREHRATATNSFGLCVQGALFRPVVPRAVSRAAFDAGCEVPRRSGPWTPVSGSLKEMDPTGVKVSSG